MTTPLQIAIMVTVLACLVWVAMRPRRRGRARRPSGGNSWSADASYNIGEAGQHHGWGGHHSASDHSGHGDDGGSGSGSDGSGGSDGGGGDGGSSSD